MAVCLDQSNTAWGHFSRGIFGVYTFYKFTALLYIQFTWIGRNLDSDFRRGPDWQPDRSEAYTETKIVH